jgi:hypothetical protein
MTGNHKDTSITRRRALVVSGGTVAAGGLAGSGGTPPSDAPTGTPPSDSASPSASAPS